MSQIGTTDISTDLVREILGETSEASAGAGDNEGKLCTSTKINKWSRYKPIRSNRVGVSLSELDAFMKSNNFGFDVMPVAKYVVGVYQWTYLRPRGGDYDENYRIDDFRNYNHYTYAPIRLLQKDFVYETVYVDGKIVQLPDLTFVVAGIPLADFYVSGFNNYLGDGLACVVGGASGAFYVANSDDTIAGKYGTTSANLAICLSKYNIAECAVSVSSTGFPTGAINCKLITLYPRINLFIPTEKGRVRRDNANAPTTETGLNGYFTSDSYPFVGWPDGDVVTIKCYELDWTEVIKYTPTFVTFTWNGGNNSVTFPNVPQSTPPSAVSPINMNGQKWVAGQQIRISVSFAIQNSSTVRFYSLQKGRIINPRTGWSISDVTWTRQSAPGVALTYADIAPNTSEMFYYEAIITITQDYTWPKYSGYPDPPAGYCADSVDITLYVCVNNEYLPIKYENKQHYRYI